MAATALRPPARPLGPASPEAASRAAAAAAAVTLRAWHRSPPAHSLAWNGPGMGLGPLRRLQPPNAPNRPEPGLTRVYLLKLWKISQPHAWYFLSPVNLYR